MRQVRCQSGLLGERYLLHEGWESLAEFKRYDAMYGLARRLGFGSTTKLWKANPVIESSVKPSDIRLVMQSWSLKRNRY